MLNILLLLTVIVVAQGDHNHFASDGLPYIPISEFRRPQNYKNFSDEAVNYKLCTFSAIAYNKCIHTLHVAQNNSLDFPLECVQKENREQCIRSVRTRATDMIVLTEHDYRAARNEGLQPVIFERDSNESLYIAVAPRNITLVDLHEAPLSIDESNHRAFHAAAFFNYQRGHNICPMSFNAPDGVSIKIVDSSEYTLTEDEFLICPDLSYDELENYQRCNVEAGLQRAVFVSRRFSRFGLRRIKRIYDTILERLGPLSPENEDPSLKNFNFFSTFEGVNDVIFKNNTVAFDLRPTYRNGVNERYFNALHCNSDDQEHNFN